MEKIILDCDPGMDDSVAMLLALSTPSIELMAVTTVNGNYPVAVTTKNALKIMSLMGRGDIPVARGMERPILRCAPPDPFSHGADGQAETNLPEPIFLAHPSHAVEVIREMVMAHPHEITLVATGPLSNIAMALIMYPQIRPLIKAVVAISGAFGFNDASFSNATGDTPQSEWNVYVDPEAAKLVYESGLNLRLIGLDVATNFRVDFTEEQIRTMASSQAKGAKFLSTAISFVKGRGFGAYCAVIDAIAVASVADKDLVSFKEYHVGVDTRDGLTLGMTVRDGRHHFVWEHLPLVNVAVDAKYVRFLQILEEGMLRG